MTIEMKKVEMMDINDVKIKRRDIIYYGSKDKNKYDADLVERLIENRSNNLSTMVIYKNDRTSVIIDMYNSKSILSFENLIIDNIDLYNLLTMMLSDLYKVGNITKSKNSKKDGYYYYVTINGVFCHLHRLFMLGYDLIASKNYSNVVVHHNSYSEGVYLTNDNRRKKLFILNSNSAHGQLHRLDNLDKRDEFAFRADVFVREDLGLHSRNDIINESINFELEDGIFYMLT